LLSAQNEQILKLLEENGRSLYRMLTRLTLREDIAEDLLQELFIKLSSSQIGSVKNLSAYAYRSAVNIAFDWRRKRQIKTIRLADIEQPMCPRSSAAENLMMQDDFEQILDAAQSLSNLSREVFVMHHIQQVSYKEIAVEFDKTEDQIRAICHKAIEKIRLKLNRQVDISSRKEANNG
jgi:RNA polymerase sigma factor (sigma-70 family)